MNIITFPCNVCSRLLKVPEQHAGKKAKCSNCANLVAIPPAPPEDVMDQPNPAGTALADGAAAGMVAIPGYAVEGELGRGAMGVVYLAHQQQPRRKVALKMVLAGDHADPEQLARFRVEAALAARLQHPNIVTIHQVGEAEGRPYLSLEYVEGGSLAQYLKGHKLPPREAAALVEQLACGAHFAHTKGILHRDLKPGNILLAPHPDGANGPLPWVPKITDFGLAKQLDGFASLIAEGPRSQTGVVLGTPSYMAPEQVRSQGAAVGPAVDVYALGAILYELLTGQPPFQADNTLDLILLVATEEPVSPCLRNPQLSRDLETICLKCLQKQPLQRYGSARELAADLRRFLDGEPIRGRRTGSLPKAGRWLKQHKEFAYLAGGALAAVALVAVLTLTVLRPAAPSAEPELTREAETPPRNKEKSKDLEEPGPNWAMIEQRMKRQASREQSQDNLKRLARAMHDYHKDHGELPPPAIWHKVTGKPLLSWRVALLPYLGTREAELYKQFHLEETWDSFPNKWLLSRMPAVYLVYQGQQNFAWDHTYYQALVGPGTPFEPTGKPGGPLGMLGRNLKEITDGPANTLLIVEAGKAVPWTKPEDLAYNPTGALPSRGGLFEDRIHAAFANGQVAAIKADLPAAGWRALITRNGGEPLPQGWMVKPGKVLALCMLTGEVHWQGKPLGGGQLVLHPVGWHAPDQFIETEIGKDGKFFLHGMPPGEYRITVSGPPGLSPALPAAYARPDTTPWRETFSVGYHDVVHQVK